MDMHIGERATRTEIEATDWKGYVTVVVHDADHNSLDNVMVTGYWRTELLTVDGVSYVKNSPPVIGKTQDGRCTYTRGGLSEQAQSVIFMIIDLAREGYIYNPVVNDVPPNAEIIWQL